MPDEKELCPTCFSELVSDEERERRIEEDPEHEIYGYSWSDDPVLTPKGLSGAEYEGVLEIKLKHIIELREAREQQEDAIGISEEDKTEFIEFEGNVSVDCKHIRELRASTEKILKDNAGIEELTDEERKELLYEYFNFDAEGNKMTPADSRYIDKDEWTDPVLANTIKIKGVHIEDLRHPLPIIFPNFALLSGEQLTWQLDVFPTLYYEFDGDYYSYTTNSKKELMDLEHYFDDSLEGIPEIKTADEKYFYAVHRTPYPASVDIIEAYSWNLKTVKRFYLSIDNYPTVKNILSDGEYLWILSHKFIYTEYPYGNFKDCLYRINIDTRLNEFVGLLPEYSDYFVEDVLSVDKKYLYIVYNKQDDIGKINKIVELNKSNLEVEKDIDHSLIYSVCHEEPIGGGRVRKDYIEEYWNFFHASSDDEYIYFRRWIWDSCANELTVNEISRISKATLGIDSFLSLSTREDLEDITIDKKFVYLLFCSKHLISTYNTDNPIGSLEIYDKKTKQLIKTFNQDIGQFSFNKYQERLLTKTHIIYGPPRYLNFYLSIATKDQGWFAKNLPKYLREE